MKAASLLPALLLSCVSVYPQGSAPATPAPAVQQQGTAPALSSPGLSQPGYLLGPGDTVRVTVWTGNEYLQENLTVAPDGTLFIPFFVNKLVNVSGLTSAQLRELVQTELESIFKNPLVQLITVGFESQKAILLGEVQSSGQFPIFGNTQLLDFIVQHGGFSANANLAGIQVTRADGKKLTVNIYDIVLKGDQSQNFLVHSGDMIFVPSMEAVSKRYFVLGEVRNPQVVLSAEDLTLLEAITKAGTLSVSAAAEHVFVVRRNVEGNEVIEVNFSDLYRKGDFSRNPILQDGDIVYVPRSRRARLGDVLNTLGPVISFVRDTVFLGDLIRR